MKKVKSEMADELRPEYKSRTLGKLCVANTRIASKKKAMLSSLNQILHELSQTTKLSTKPFVIC